MRCSALTLFVITCLGTGIGEIASAADAPLPAPRAAVVPTWAGGYIGITGGYAWGRDRWMSDELDPAGGFCPSPLTCGPQPFSLSGWTVGALIGVNVQQGNWVVGAELDASYASVKGSLTYPADPDTEIRSLVEKLQGTAHARLRFGYAMGHWLPYAAAGVAVAKVKLDLNGFTEVDIPDESRSLYRVGFSVGGGVDVMVTPNAILRAEYLYDQYGTTGFGTVAAFDQVTLNNLHTHTVRGALIWKFDRPVVAAAPAGGVYKAPPAAVAPAWAGAYIGVAGGYLRGRDIWSSDESEPAACNGDIVPGCGPQRFNVSGWTVGGLVGANVQQGHWVLGSEIDVNYVSADGGLTLGGPFSDYDSLREDIRWNAHARMRFGYAFGQWLPFVAGGVALAGTNIRLVAPDFSTTVRSHRVGFSAGGGVDIMASPNAIVRVEYLHDRYGNALFSANNDSQTFGSLSTHTIRGAAIWKLDPGPDSSVSAVNSPAATTAAFAGFYAGATAGHTWGRDALSSDEASPVNSHCVVDPPPCGPQRFDLPGGLYGVLGGINFQQGRLVTGPELDVSVAQAKGRLDFDPTTNDVAHLAEHIQATAHARWRFGYAFGNVLPFAAGGVALAKAKVSYLGDDGGPMRSDKVDLYRVGFSAGGGIEYKALNTVVRLEYLYDQYGSSGFGSGTGVVLGDNLFVGDLSTHTVRGAVIWNFGPVAAR
jgi:outer membrane immunogenic protein